MIWRLGALMLFAVTWTRAMARLGWSWDAWMVVSNTLGAYLVFDRIAERLGGRDG